MTTATRQDVLEIIQRFAPRQWRTTGNPRSRYIMRCPVCEHESSSGRDSYFTVDDNRQLFHCFVCDASGGPRRLEALLTGKETTPPLTRPSPKAGPGSKSKQPPPLQGITLTELATAKELNQSYLEQTLGWQDYNYYGTPAILIPYPDENNENVIGRYRVGLDSADRFRWQPGKGTRPYGLWNQRFFKDRGFVILVEGETDTATLLFHGYPALGFPGASTVRPPWTESLQDLDVYVWREPDVGGATFTQKVLQHIPSARVITPPDGIKDATDMAAQAGAGFKDLMDELLAEATPRASQPAETAPPETGGRSWQHVLESPTSTAIRDLRERVVQGYRYMGDPVAVSQVQRCALWLRVHGYDCEVREGRGYHCNKRGCPNCTMMRLSLLFKEKREAIGNVVGPAVIELRSLYQVPLSYSYDEMKQVFTDGITRVRSLLSDWTRLRGRIIPLAHDHIYNITCRVDDQSVAHFGAVLFGGLPDGDIGGWFSVRLGHVVIPIIHSGESQEATERLFRYLVVLGFEWQHPIHFEAWCSAMKKKKLVQGKGRFSKVSGSKPPSRPGGAVELAVCPVHGVLEQVVKTTFIAPPELFFPYYSEHTGRVHYLFTGDNSSLYQEDDKDEQNDG